MFCSWNKRFVLPVLGLVLLMAVTSPAFAQQKPKFELGLNLGAGLLDKNLMGNAESLKEVRPLIGLRAATLGKHFNLFADVTYGGYDTIDPSIDITELHVRLGTELLLPELKNHSQFFLSAALGWADYNYHFNPGAPPPDQQPRGFDRSLGAIGVGQRFCIGNFDYIRWELLAENTISDDGIGGKDITNFKGLIGYTFGLGGPPPDEDGDGVKNCYDECPNTPKGCKVDGKGCPLDSDGDGVCDGLDQCPDTPKGWAVDANGCPIDSDGDGVPDAIDSCPNTPKGCQVDAKGCPIDSDGDGVCDGIDRCPNTPKGCVVDAYGCPIDSDGDGVCDGLDKCPGTPAGIKVDATGCPPPPPPFMPTKTLVLKGVNFDSDKATLTPASLAVLDGVVAGLKDWPDIRVEIGGHCDATNTHAHNQKLSERRAEAVYQYLLAKGIAANRMTTKGYGETVPIADNKTKEGRAINRRVELTKLN
jgi:outer membrane protein OmpA-like peptidoglycan-associated protein